MSPDPVDVSILVPAHDEAMNLTAFVRLVARIVAQGQADHPRPVRYELVIVDDGSRDDTWACLEHLAREHAFLRLARHRARRGIADALHTGAAMAWAPVLVFYPADLQFHPDDIPALVAPILRGDADLVTGAKRGPYEKRIVSGVYNTLCRRLFGVEATDLNSVKAFRAEVLAELPERPEWHRFLVVLAARAGFRIAEVPVTLYPRRAGRSKFGATRIPVGLADLAAVWFEVHGARKPLLLFGVIGGAMLGLGVLAGAVAVGVLAVTGQGMRAVWTVIQTAVLGGAIALAAGLVSEQIASLRAELRAQARDRR